MHATYDVIAYVLGVRYLENDERERLMCFRATVPLNIENVDDPKLSLLQRFNCNSVSVSLLYTCSRRDFKMRKQTIQTQTV